MTVPVNAKLSRGALLARRREAEARGDVHPLRRARWAVGDAGISTAMLSQLSTVSPATIRDLETSRSPGTDRTWQRLAGALHVAEETIRP